MMTALSRQKIERDAALATPRVPRELLAVVRERLIPSLITVITGPRRAGKSVFCMQLLAGRDFAYVNFDDERLAGVTDFDALMQGVIAVYGPLTTILFDEIQNLPGWELAMNRLQRQGYHLVITGSNAHLLGRELATHLTGRFLEFRLFPFSFGEYLTARGATPDPAAPDGAALLLHHFTAYLTTGGYPEVVVNNAPADAYLSALFDSMLFKDVVRRYGVKYPRKIHELALYLTTNHSAEYTVNALKNALGFNSVHTVDKYLSYLEESFIYFPVERYYPKLKQLLKAPRKGYAVDLGMVAAVKFKSAPDTGRLLENLVALELARRGVTFYSYKGATGKECDFIIREGLRTTQAIQVAQETTPPKTRKRELAGLAAAARELECADLLCLTMNETWTSDIDGMTVTAMPTWRWLLHAGAGEKRHERHGE